MNERNREKYVKNKTKKKCPSLSLLLGDDGNDVGKQSK
jgi:hypothetical protein